MGVRPVNRILASDRRLREADLWHFPGRERFIAASRRLQHMEEVVHVGLQAVSTLSRARENNRHSINHKMSNEYSGDNLHRLLSTRAKLDQYTRAKLDQYIRVNYLTSKTYQHRLSGAGSPRP